MKTLMEENSEKAIDTIRDFINEALNGDETKPKYGYVLMVFGFDETCPTLTYVSNAQNESMAKLLRYQADLVESHKSDDEEIKE